MVEHDLHAYTMVKCEDNVYAVVSPDARIVFYGSEAQCLADVKALNKSAVPLLSELMSFGRFERNRK